MTRNHNFHRAQKKKGAAATMMTILLIIILLGFLVVFLGALSKQQRVSESINYKEAGIMRLANTFSLLNRSLGMTWYIFTAQSVFHATDNSVLCGFDDADITGDEDFMPEKYWYFYNRNDAKDNQKVTGFLDANPDGYTDKYNFKPPNDAPTHVCYPTSQNAIDILAERFSTLNTIKPEFVVNGIKAAISDISTTFNLNDDERVETITKQTIKLGEESSGLIKEDTENTNQIYTEFRKMLEFGRFIVKELAFIADKFSYDSGLRYQDVNIGALGISTLYPDLSAANYMARIANGIKADVKFQELAHLKKARAYANYNAFEAHAVNLDVNDNFVFGAEDIVTYGGLVLHYDMSVNVQEGGTTTKSCPTPREDYQNIITVMVNELDDDGWDFSDRDLLRPLARSFVFSNDDIVHFADALFLKESSWDPNAVSCAGAVGLGQLMPDTARTYMAVPSYDKISQIFCDGSSWIDVDKCNKKNYAVDPTSCDLTIDERFDAERNIRASVEYMYGLMERFSEYAANEEELLRLTLVAYNWGPTRLENTTNSMSTLDKGNVRFEDIVDKLPEVTQQYVFSVMGAYACYGGFLTSASDAYYYNDEADDRFIKKPFAMEIKAKDYLPAIDCNDKPYEDNGMSEGSIYDTTRFFAWAHNPRVDALGSAIAGRGFYTADVMCCGSRLWSCNANVPGLASLDSGGTALLTGQPADCSAAGLSGEALGVACADDGFQFTVGGFVQPAIGCSTLMDSTSCTATQGCWWHPGSGRCFDCTQTSSCSTYNNNPFACDSCATTSGDFCASQEVGDSGYRCVKK